MASLYEKRIRIIGSMGKMSDLREGIGKNNAKVIDFGVAVSIRKRVNDEWVDGDTIWTNCTAWNDQAKHIANSFKPGDRIYVEGVADMKSGFTAKDGTEIPASEYLLVERIGHESSYNDTSQERRSKDSSSAPASKKTQAVKKEPEPVTDDDIDFSIDDDDFEMDQPF